MKSDFPKFGGATLILNIEIFEMSLAPLNFENHFFVFDSGLQKSLLLNTNRSKSLENLIRYN